MAGVSLEEQLDSCARIHLVFQEGPHYRHLSGLFRRFTASLAFVTDLSRAAPTLAQSLRSPSSFASRILTRLPEDTS